jgi:hypothetical protein
VNNGRVKKKSMQATAMMDAAVASTNPHSNAMGRTSSRYRNPTVNALACNAYAIQVMAATMNAEAATRDRRITACEEIAI